MTQFAYAAPAIRATPVRRRSGAGAPPSGRPWTAWAEWAGWRGPPELVSQIARAALWAVSEEVQPQEAMCSIELHVATDVERFRDPMDFREHATPDGLRHFDWPAIRVMYGDDDVRVRLSPSNVKKGRPGVVLLATAAEPKQAENMRDTVAASIDRRTGRHRQLKGVLEGSVEEQRRLSGGLADLTGDFIDHFIDYPSRLAHRPAQRWPLVQPPSPPPASRLETEILDEQRNVATGWAQRAWRGTWDFFGPDQETVARAADAGVDLADLEGPAMRWGRRVWRAFLLVWAFAFLLALTGDPASSDVASQGSALVLACAALGAAAWAIVRWIRPNVEVTPASRLQRILSLAWKGALAAVVSVAIGKSIELLIG